MRHIPPTNVGMLASHLRARHYRFAFPSGLPDRWIRPIARDLREIEQVMEGDDSVGEPNMAGPLMITTHLLLGRMKERGVQAPIEMSEELAARWFRLYQVFVERELVTRTIGIPGSRDEDALVTALDSEIDSAIQEW